MSEQFCSINWLYGSPSFQLTLMNGPFPAMASLGGAVIVALVLLVVWGDMSSLILANSTFSGVVFSTFAIFSNVVLRKESLFESKAFMTLVKVLLNIEVVATLLRNLYYRF